MNSARFLVVDMIDVLHSMRQEGYAVTAGFVSTLLTCRFVLLVTKGVIWTPISEAFSIFEARNPVLVWPSLPGIRATARDP
jgi:hypothetical protein